MATRVERCGNAGCACPPRADGSYCSSYCANVDRHAADAAACACDHAACAASQRVAPTGGTGEELRTSVGPEPAAPTTGGTATRSRS